MPGKHTSLEDKIKINDLLRKYAKVEGDYCVYSEGWDDAKIAKAVNVTALIVAAIRKELFGKLHSLNPRGHNGQKTIELEANLAQAQAALQNVTQDYLRLFDRVIDLEDKHNRLCDQLTMNQVTQVKHLKVDRKTLSPHVNNGK